MSKFHSDLDGIGVLIIDADVVDDIMEILFEKRMMHDQYWRGYESALSTIKALVSGRIKAYENSTDEKNRERVEAFRDILLQDIASLEDTMKRLWRR